VVGDRLALGEVAAQEALLHRVLHVVPGGQVQHPVRVEGVAAPGALEVELPAVGGRRPGHLPVHLVGLRAGDAVLGGEVAREVAGRLARRLRVELEAVEADLDLVTVGEAGEGLLEPALPDRAPRADDVGPDLHLHVHRNSR
jgi:hypothetical protein